jgi:hypothetical protein
MSYGELDLIEASKYTEIMYRVNALDSLMKNIEGVNEVLVESLINKLIEAKITLEKYLNELRIKFEAPDTTYIIVHDDSYHLVNCDQ